MQDVPPNSTPVSDDRLQARVAAELALGALPTVVLLERLAQPSDPTPWHDVIAAMGSRILSFGAPDAQRHALVRTLPGGASEWPLAKVDEAGQFVRLGTLHALVSGQWYLAPAPGIPTDTLWWGSDHGVFDGLPWYMDALFPQGFLGQAFGIHAAECLSWLPRDIHAWGDDHIVLVASAIGQDMPGNLVLGDAIVDASPARHLARLHDTPTSLATWVDVVTAGRAAGSVVGGEQPKFALPRDGRNPARIVKFSPTLDSTAGRRWGDLLVAEHVASATLAACGIRVAANRVHQQDRRMYLESERFDRTPSGGRRGFCHLSAPTACAGGGLDDWERSAALLAREGLLAPRDVETVAFLHAFGLAIGNADMHHGNLGLLGSPETGWALAPVYDMLPMRYAPGHITETAPCFRPTPTNMPSPVRTAAAAFWNGVATHSLVSPEFSAIAAKHALALAGPPAPHSSRLPCKP